MSKPSVKARRKSLPRNINLRVKPHTRSLIDRACAITDKTVTEFVLDAVCREAEGVLLDRRLFNLDATAYQVLIAVKALCVLSFRMSVIVIRFNVILKLFRIIPY